MIVTADVSQTHWSYEDTQAAGNGPLLLLHGFTGCSDFWMEIADELKNDFRCIVPDLPGHGRTKVREVVENFHLRTVAESLAALLDCLEIDKTAVWGYSMGGRLALQFAVAFPQRVSRLVLESASPGIADREKRERRRESDEKLADEIEANGVTAFVDRWEKRPLFAWHRDLPDAKRERSRVLRLANTAQGLALSLRGMGTGAQEPLDTELPKLRVPTLVLAGEHDGKFQRIGRGMANEIPDSAYRVVPGAGHTTFWEQPDVCLKIVRPFLLGDRPPDLFITEPGDAKQTS